LIKQALSSKINLIANSEKLDVWFTTILGFWLGLSSQIYFWPFNFQW